MIPCIFITKKLNKIKLTYITVFVLLFTLPLCALSQQRKIGGNGLLNLPKKSIRLDSLSHLIANETGFIFSFNASQINPGKKITVPATIKRLDGLLAYLKEQYRLDYKTIGNHIILYNTISFNKTAKLPFRKPPNPLPQKKDAISNKEKTAGIRPSKKTLVHSTLPDIKTNITLKTTPLILPKKLTHLVINPDFIPQLKSSSLYQRKIVDSFSKQDSFRKRKNAYNPHLGRADHSFSISAGVTANEVLYLNPTIRVGLPWLYASAAWKTNFKTSGFFYGIGTRIKLSDSWKFGLSISNGSLSRKFKVESLSSDSTLRIKTRLTGIHFLIEKQFSKRLSLEFGPVFKFMKNNYSLMDISLGNSSLPVASNMSNNYNIIQPPYILSKRYNEQKNTGTKVWIGLQIDLFYRLW